jgi:hypothetical protein
MGGGGGNSEVSQSSLSSDYPFAAKTLIRAELRAVKTVTSVGVGDLSFFSSCSTCNIPWTAFEAAFG